jgi:CRP-like cAMP-binding protein
MPHPARLDDLSQNGLLALLPADEQERLRPALDRVALGPGQGAGESSGLASHAYFPTGAVVSLLYTMEDGMTAEMGLVGNDGVVGIAHFLGGETMPNRAVAAVGGAALRMRADVIRAEFSRGGALQHLLLRYTQALITQVSQTAVCNRLHSVEKRLCRWLLLSHDRVRCDELLMTQEFIAHMLGGRRESVTVAAARLQDAGLIRYSRGRIRILDRPRLEGAVCECYRVVRDETRRLLGEWRRGRAYEAPRLWAAPDAVAARPTGRM